MTRPSGQALDAYRSEGDAYADQLIASVLDAPATETETQAGLAENLKRYRYNHLLSVADRLLISPELMLRQDSEMAMEMSRYPQAMRDYYSPVDLPGWVEPDRLRRASELWQDNMVAILGVLYAASLPYCYTIRHGLPLLYDTGKLLKPEFIYQRIHETGLMLEAVMKPQGLRVVEDIGDGFRTSFERALKQLRPEGQWSWKQGEFHWHGEQSDLPEWDEILQTMEGQAGNTGGLSPRRFLWGDGLVATRKVRLLHAAMRYMILNPAYGHVSDRFDPAPGWDLDRYGRPINQEDLAFTLLTFSYVIPRGLERLGCKLSLYDRECFLHCWKLVGHELGIRQELLTDRWDEAESLFAELLQRQGGPCEQGKALTATLFDFFGDYLPNTLGLNKALGPVMVRHQLGDTADWLMTEEQQRQSRRWLPRSLWACVCLLLAIYYPIRNRLLFRFGFVHRRMGGVLHRTGMALVDSWRGAFLRRAFYLPQYLNAAWKRPAAAGPEFRQRLRRWRHKLINNIALGLAGLIGGVTGLAAVTIAGLLFGLEGLEWGLGACLALVTLAGLQLGPRMNAIIASRPRLPD